MQKKVTDIQIEELFVFTRKHFVEWYDLQCELVDHLINDIEHIWQENPNLSFVQARDKSFKKFGVFGFMDVVEAKTKQLDKKYWKLIWQEFKLFFTIPKIILTIALWFLTLEILQKFQHQQYLILIFAIALFVYPVVHSIKFKRTINQRTKKTGKKWLFEQYIFGLGGILNIIQLPFHVLSRTHEISSVTELYFITTFIVVFGLLVYIMVHIIPEQIQQIIAKENPEYREALNLV